MKRRARIPRSWSRAPLSSSGSFFLSSLATLAAVAAQSEVGGDPLRGEVQDGDSSSSDSAPARELSTAKLMAVQGWSSQIDQRSTLTLTYDDGTSYVSDLFANRDLEIFAMQKRISKVELSFFGASFPLWEDLPASQRHMGPMVKYAKFLHHQILKKYLRRK